jgi:hypothetical protein
VSANELLLEFVPPLFNSISVLLLSEENASSTYIKPLSEANWDNMEVRAVNSAAQFNRIDRGSETRTTGSSNDEDSEHQRQQHERQKVAKQVTRRVDRPIPPIRDLS